MSPRAGLDGRKISCPQRFDPGPSSPVAQLLYRLSYRVHKLNVFLFSQQQCANCHLYAKTRVKTDENCRASDENYTYLLTYSMEKSPT